MRMQAYRRSAAFDAMLAAARPSDGGRYGAARGGRWRVVAAIVALHLAGLYALMALDMIVVTRAKAPPTVVTLLPDVPPPPPAASPDPEPVTPTPVEMVTPPPLVATPVAALPPMRTVETPAPPAPVAVVAAPAARTGPPAEPVVPPDFAGDQLANPAPRYPIESRRRKEQGTVVVRVMVTAGGRADACRLHQTSGFDRLDKAALDVVCRWRFQPATRGGTPVSWPMDVPIPFVLRS